MKIIFADVDGTIYDETNVICNELKKDIIFAKSKGYKFYVATGNPILSKMHWLAKELDIRYFISSNGAGIYDYKVKKFLYKSLINHESIKKILNLSLEMNIFCDFWDENYIYVSSIDHSDSYNKLINVTLLKNYDKKSIKIADINKKINSFKIEVYSDSLRISKFHKKLLEMNLNLQIAIMSNNHIEITNNNVSKKSGINIFLKKVFPNVNIKDCMTIGDSSNDEMMIKASNYSYAMGNAPKNIKKIAKYVTNDINHNGLGNAIRHYILKMEVDK